MNVVYLFAGQVTVWVHKSAFISKWTKQMWIWVFGQHTSIMFITAHSRRYCSSWWIVICIDFIVTALLEIWMYIYSKKNFKKIQRNIQHLTKDIINHTIFHWFICIVHSLYWRTFRHIFKCDVPFYLLCKKGQEN